MISYLELLNRVKNNDVADLILLKLNCGERYYQAYYDNDEFNYYGLCNEDEENADFRYYLSETLLESQMFDEIIEIIPDEENTIENLDLYYNRLLTTLIFEIKDKINEIIDKLNEMSGSDE